MCDEEYKQSDSLSEPDPCQVLETAMDAGHILLENGAEIFRVKETMGRICRCFGVEYDDFLVLSNGIFTMGGSDGMTPFAQIRYIPNFGTRLDKVVAVNQLSREIEKGSYSLEMVNRRLEEIRQMPGEKAYMQVLATGLESACFCYMFGGSMEDVAAAFLAGSLLYIYMLKVGGPHRSRLVGHLGGGMLLTFLCIVCHNLGLGEHLDLTIIGTIIPLVPGVAFTNGIRDIADGDYISGAVRLLDAILVFTSVGIGVGMMFMLYCRLMGGVGLHL